MALIPQDNVLRNQLISAQTRLVNAQGMKVASSGIGALGKAVYQMTPEGKQAREDAVLRDKAATQVARAQGIQAEAQIIAPLLAQVEQSEDPAGAYAQAVRTAEAAGVDIPAEFEVYDPDNFQHLKSIYTMPPEEMTEFEGLLGGLSPEARAQAVAVKLGLAPDANATLRGQASGAFSLPPGGARFDANGNVIAEREPTASNRKIITGADGRKYFADTGELVLSGVTASAKERRIVTGADGRKYYEDTKEPVLPGVSVGDEKPLSSIGKLRADLEAGRITDEDFAKEMEKDSGVTVNVGEGMKLTEGQSKDLGYYTRGLYALDDLEKVQGALTSLDESFMSRLGTIGNLYASPEFRSAKIAADQLLAVILRKDTGAAITSQEFDLYGPQFLPMPGDDPAALEQKRKSRQRAIQAIRLGLGTATPLADEVDRRYRAEASDGQIMIDPQTGKKYRQSADGSLEQID